MAQSKPIKRKIVSMCSPYDIIQVGFGNQMGGYDFWYFNQKFSRKVEVVRNEFQKVLDPEYSIGDRGRTVYSLSVNEKFKVESDWLSEYDSQFLEELVLTTEAFWIKEDGPHPIIVTIKEYNTEYDINGNMFNMVLEFELAYDKNTVTQ